MLSSKQNTITSSLIILLLLVQVILSALIIKRLNDNDQALNAIKQRVARVVDPQQPEVPSYVEAVSVDDDPWLGNENAPITIVEFADYECPFCSEASAVVKRLLLEYEGQILFVYRDLPLEHLHVNAFKAAEAANCAGEQGHYWEMYDLLFANQGTLNEHVLKALATELEIDAERFNSCLDSAQFADEVRRDVADAQDYQISRTPTFFVNGYRVTGSSHKELSSAIEAALYESTS